MKCPRCSTDLIVSDRQGVEIDHCPQCRGVWLDRGELDKIIDRGMDWQRGGRDDRNRDDNDDSPGGRRRGFLGGVFDIFD